MNKKELIDRVTELVDLKKFEVKEVVDIMVEEMEKELAKGKTVSLVGFGNFSPRYKASREGRDPKTHKKIIIPSAVHIGFKMGQKLKTMVKESAIVKGKLRMMNGPGL